jgi:hypothetical protein
MNGATGMESNLQPRPYKRSALPFELQWLMDWIIA